MRIAIALIAGWVTGGLLFLAYLAEPASIPLWLAPLVATGTTAVAYSALR